MKIIAFIMALLLVVLSVMPCTDEGIAIKEAKEKATLNKVADQQNADHPDDCSPFCHCSCCAGFSINHAIVTLNLPPNFSVRFANRFLNSDAIQVIAPIWQPPRYC